MYCYGPLDEPFGQMLKINASHFPAITALKDKERSFTYPETNRRVNRLSQSLLSLGLKKGDKAAVLLENCKDSRAQGVEGGIASPLTSHP